MFTRLQFLSVLPEHVDGLKRLYREEIIPASSRFEGFMNILLLEPTYQSENFIAMSQWRSPGDAEVYASSNIYREQREKVMGFLTKDAVLKTYHVELMAKEIPLWVPEAAEEGF